MHRLTYGLFVLTGQDGKDNGCITNTCLQVGSDPTRLAVSVQMGNLTREVIENSGKFNVSVLTEEVPFETIRHFGMQSGWDVDKFADFVGFDRSHNGLPYLTDHTNAMFSCEVKEKVNLGAGLEHDLAFRKIENICKRLDKFLVRLTVHRSTLDANLHRIAEKPIHARL